MHKVEDDIRKLELEGDKKRDYRQQKAKPLVDPIFTWNREQLRRLDLVPTHPPSKAPGYFQKREMELQVCLDDASVDIDTPHLERAPRCIPTGRKNWMFCWTLEGQTSVAVFHALIVSCRLAGIDPYKYLFDYFATYQPSSGPGYPGSDTANLEREIRGESVKIRSRQIGVVCPLFRRLQINHLASNGRSELSHCTCYQPGIKHANPIKKQ